MASNDSRVEEVKNILYLDGDDDNQLLNMYVTAADSFVRNAIGDDVNGFYNDSGVKSLVETAVTSLAATYYQNRLALSDTQTYPVDMTVNSIIGQLRSLRDTFEEGEGDENTGKSTQSSN